MQQTRVSVGSVTTAAAKCVRSDRDHYRIIVSLIAIILISYRLSIGDSIWHIVTALVRIWLQVFSFLGDLEIFILHCSVIAFVAKFFQCTRFSRQCFEAVTVIETLI